MSDEDDPRFHPATATVANFLAIVRGEAADLQLGDLVMPDLAPALGSAIEAGDRYLSDLAENWGPLSDARRGVDGSTLIVLVRVADLEEYGGRVPDGGGLMKVHRMQVTYLPDDGTWKISAIGDAAPEAEEEGLPELFG